MTADQVRFPQGLFVDDRSRFKRIESIEIDDRVGLVKSGVVKPALGQPTDQRHLPAFKSKPNAAAGAGLLSFVTFAARLTVSGAFAATETFDPVPRTRTGPQIMQSHHDVAGAGAGAFPSPLLIPRTFKISSRRRKPRNASTVALTTFA